jgi:phosphoesterase RecJ-like protein
MKTNFGNMYKLLKDAKTVAIVGHVRPDGDCIGSCVALRLALLKMKKTADIFLDDEIPETFSYIRNFAHINDAEFITKNAWKDYGLLVIVDTPTEQRTGRCAELFKHSKKVLVVDHHEKTTITADVVVTSAERGSVGAILYEFFTENKIEITKNMATALYTAIVTDTGCFAYATTEFTHKAAAALIEIGVDIEMINYNNFGCIKHTTLLGLGYALQNLKFFLDGQVALVAIPYAIFKKYELAGEMDYFKKYAADAKGVKMGIISDEKKKGEFYISLRSHGGVNVAAVAETFGGGGHKRAAAFVARGNFKKILAELLAKAEKCLQK